MEKPVTYQRYLLIAVMVLAIARLGIDALEEFAGRRLVASNMTIDIVLVLLLALVLRGATYSNESDIHHVRYANWLVPVCCLLVVGSVVVSIVFTFTVVSR